MQISGNIRGIFLHFPRKGFSQSQPPNRILNSSGLLYDHLILYLSQYAPLRSISVTNSANVRRNLREQPELLTPSYGTKDRQQVETYLHMPIQNVLSWHVQGIFFPSKRPAAPDYIVGFFSLPSPCLYISFLLGLTYAYFYIYYTYYA